MILEVLYPELGTLFGDAFHVKYLMRCAKDAQLIETHLGEKPAFLSADQKPDLVYRGSLTESAQVRMIRELKKEAPAIADRIRAGQRFLITGNAIEVFGQRISDDPDQLLYPGASPEQDALGLLPFVTKRKMLERQASLYLGKYKDIDVIGYKATFSTLFAEKPMNPWIRTTKGPGMGPDLPDEGFRLNNFFATTLLGPLLIINPNLCLDFLADFLPQETFALPYPQEAMNAYRIKLQTMLDPKTVYQF